MANRLKTQIQFSDDQSNSNTFDTIETKRFEDHYECLQTIGQGAHAVVKTARKKGTDEIYAVKIVRSGDQEIQNNVRRTFNNTRCLKHSNIAQDIELYINEKSETSFLVMEYCNFPSLETVIKKRVLTSEELKVIIKQLLLAVQHSHSKGICHRDLKPDNILVNLEENSNPPHVKLVDFGVSRRFVSKGQEIDMLTKTGNIFYCAPEIFHSSSYSKEVDIWAIGVIIYQCTFQKLPLHSNELSDFINLLGSPDKWTFKESLTQLELPLSNLIMSMLNPKSEGRITAEEAIRHPFFEIGTIRDVMALLSKDNIERDNCERCKSLQNSLKMNEQWGNVIKKLQNSVNENENININDLVQDFGNIHIIQRHTVKCGQIQLMNSVGSSNAFMSKLGSRQEILDKSCGLQFCGSSNKTIHQDPFGDICNIQSSLEMKEELYNSNNKLIFQLGNILDQNQEITPSEWQLQTQKQNIQQEQQGSKKRGSQVNRMLNELGIKEVDEITEDQS
ncbi:unnamed protein product (macronuclear) [Paramecium tetraurelia]|uniref:Protein kinase domain-containing protein n=1 Tax=Paramecium tetraurelia TaxID=5888 RepID=A0DSI0_PARTE|nr:uncharacterized protein GSPATT00019701001 [Paramecium tetraurelia]CAK85997.1 unnamed protein product [Paramecium tetraurelia]|eukprot:XP_001453394.1 hypothetical protein (macronuclear) [Paramecium tetraurelia strain d4-2]